MSFFGKATTKRLVAVHGWSGTVLGLILYVVVLTGSIAVFATEITEWTSGSSFSHTAFDQPVHDTLVTLADDIDPAYMDDIAIFSRTGGLLQVLFHTHEKSENGTLRDKGTRFLLDARNLEIQDRQDGYLDEMPSGQDGLLTSFIVRLHINLHAPNPWGMWMTGVLGFVMLIASISGIFLHRHMIRDLFVAPRWSSVLLNRRDRHILAGSWTLPFGFLLAFTGMFFSFAGTLAVPVVAVVAFGGDQEKLLELATGVPVQVDPRPGQRANVDEILAHARRVAGSAPGSVSIQHWGRKDARITVAHAAPETGLLGSRHIFDGATGAYLGEKPAIGPKPSTGSDVIGLMGPLHFGHFGGLLSKIIWLSLGLATSYITLTGLQLWVERRSDQPGWAWLGPTVITVGYGTGIGLAASGAAFFLSLPSQQADFWTPAGFLIGSALSILIGMALRRNGALERSLAGVLAALLIALPILRMVMGHGGWATHFAQGHAAVIGIDLTLCAAGALIAWWAFIRQQFGPLAQRNVQMPAE
ncbi:MAG: PepSY domain-containing protein [Pseudomonadota bacterium]